MLLRIRGINLETSGAQYHHPCYSKFSLPSRPAGGLSGRPQDPDVTWAMERIFEYLKKHEDQCRFSLRELSNVIRYSPPSDATIKAKLREKFAKDIVITSLPGRLVICFRNHELLLDSWYEENKTNEEEERLRIVRKAAAIISEDIKSQIYNVDYYPRADKFLDSGEEDVPQTLQIFLDEVILKKKRKSKDKYKKKCLGIAHSIIAATRPKSFLSCIQIGLAATLFHKTGSRNIIDILSSFGFCASYLEASTFQLSAVLHPDATEPRKGFFQFVGDNADVNINTLDGLGTFHAMGMITIITPRTEAPIDTGRILRLKDIPSATAIGQHGFVPLQTFERSQSQTELEKLKVLEIRKDDITMSASDFIWMYGKMQNFPDIGGWNGFMEQLKANESFSTSAITTMPFINAPPDDYDTVLTTLLLAYEGCQKVGQQTCIVTFDQKLYQKARYIVTSSLDPRLKSVVVRLGGFHLIMSYLGSIGYIKAGSGLSELLSTIYAPNIDCSIWWHARTIIA